MRVRGLRKKLYLLTYDKQRVNKKAMQIRKSLEEVKKMLQPPQPGK